MNRFLTQIILLVHGKRLSAALKMRQSEITEHRKLEREQIISLIEDNMMGRDSWLDVIELIKGEQK